MPNGIDPERAARLYGKLWKGQAGLCVYCGMPMAKKKQVPSDHRDRATFDHIIPKVAGGTYAFTNIVLAHRRCNLARKDGPTPPFVIDMQGIGGRAPWRGYDATAQDT